MRETIKKMVLITTFKRLPKDRRRERERERERERMSVSNREGERAV